MKKLATNFLPILWLLVFPVKADPISIGYYQDFHHAPGTAGLGIEYQGVFGLQPVRAIGMAWRLSDGPEQGDNAYAGLELDIVNVSGRYGRFLAGVGAGAFADRDTVVKKNEAASFSFTWCGLQDKVCGKARHMSNPGVDDRGYNFGGIWFQAWF